MSNFSCLLVGPPGAGKTTAALTAVKLHPEQPMLFLDVDNKLHKMQNAEEYLKSGKVIQWAIDEPLYTGKLSSFITGATDPQKKMTQKRAAGYIKLGEMIDTLIEGKGRVDGRQVGTVVLDSYTSMEEHLKRLLMTANSAVTISQPLWGTVLTNYENLNHALVNQLGKYCNIIFICHETPNKDELTGKIVYSPLISGQMRNKVGKDFEEVYFMEKTVQGGVAKYEMLTVGSSMKACRTSRTLNARVEPDFSLIYK